MCLLPETDGMEDRYDPSACHILLTTPTPSPLPDPVSLLSTSSGNGTDAASTPNGASSSSKTEPKVTQKPIGTIRWIPKLGKVSRLVVAKDYRKFGFGRILMEGLERIIAETPVNKRSELGTLEEVEGRQVVKVALNSQARSSSSWLLLSCSV